MFLPFLPHFFTRHLVPNPPDVRPSYEQFARSLTSFSKSRHLFTLKAVVVPIAGITFFVWCIVKAHGIGPVVKQPAKLHDSDLGWAMVFSLMSCISNMATLVTYVFLSPDLAQIWAYTLQ